MTRDFRRVRMALAAAVAAPALHAEGQSITALTDPRAFGTELIDAIRVGQGESRLRVVHPMSRRCITSSTQPYHDWWFGKQRRVVGPGRPTVKVERFDAASASLPADGRSDYPIVPTHRLRTDFPDGPHGRSGLIAYVAPDGGQWKEVLPCPRGDVVEQARLRTAEDRAQAARVRSQLADMPPGSKRELRALVTEGRKVDAIRRYAAATGQDLSTAKAVVGSLSRAAQR